jgi:hypothetical protein
MYSAWLKGPQDDSLEGRKKRLVEMDANQLAQALNPNWGRMDAPALRSRPFVNGRLLFDPSTKKYAEGLELNPTYTL